MLNKKPSTTSFWRVPEVRVLLISLAHGVNDMYAGFLPAFIPYIKANLGLNYALAGSFNVVVGFFHIICQPWIGYMCDRIRRPFLMIVGPILCGVGAVLIPNAGTYGSALFFAGLWGFGSALYHPQGSGGIGYVSRPEHLTRSLTWFNIAGTIGVMLSPVVAVTAVRIWGYGGLVFTLLPALLLAPLLYFAIPTLREITDEDRRRKGFFATISSLFALLYPIWAMSLVRDLVFQCVRFFIPLRIAAEGGSLESVGTILFFITLGGSLAMVPMEGFARRHGGRTALRGSMILASVTLTAAAFVTGFPSAVLYLLGVSCVYSTLPLTVAMAQRLVPGERSAASSIVMGLAWGLSNILVSPFGKVADLIGLNTTLILVGLLPLVGLPFLKTRAFQDANVTEPVLTPSSAPEPPGRS